MHNMHDSEAPARGLALQAEALESLEAAYDEIDQAVAEALVTATILVIFGLAIT
jgi:hypothetical protein